MRRELKRQIKQNELATGLERSARWARGHTRELQTALVALALTAAVVLALRGFRERQARAGEAALAAALQTFHAPLAAELAEGEPRPSMVYATSAEKLKKALGQFEAVQKRFSGTVAERARYYAALSRLELGELPEAEKTLSQIAARKDGEELEPSLARLALADLHRRSGRLDKAAEAYRQMVDDSSFAFPRDHALMKLGSVLEEARRLQEARASYRRLAEEHPASVYAGEARQRAEYLQPS